MVCDWESYFTATAPLKEDWAAWHWEFISESVRRVFPNVRRYQEVIVRWTVEPVERPTELPGGTPPHRHRRLERRWDNGTRNACNIFDVDDHIIGS